MKSSTSDLNSHDFASIRGSKFVSIRGSKWLLLGLGLLIVFVINFPVLTVALNSFRTTENILSARNILPTEATLANYFYINSRTHFWTFLLNSGVVALGSTGLGIVLAALAGFALSRFRGVVLGSYNHSSRRSGYSMIHRMSGTYRSGYLRPNPTARAA